MADPTSIVVKHIPSALSTENQVELLKLFDAKNVRCVAKNDKAANLAFATFDSHEKARNALNKLHQLKVLNRRLVVEYVEEEYQSQLPKQNDSLPAKVENSESVKLNKVSAKEQLKLEAEEFARTLHSTCPALGLNYLPSPLLKYNYPSPTATIIANISHALVAVPKFYTQVLHLMNKMNLPAPFGPVTPAPPFLTDDTTVVIDENKIYSGNDIHEVEEMDTGTEDESEIESDNDNTNPKPHHFEPAKKPKAKRRRKELKYQHFIPTVPTQAKTMDSRTEPSDVFESQKAVESQKKIQFNIKPHLQSAPDATPLDIPLPCSEDTGFGIIEAPKQHKISGNELCEGELLEDSKFISRDELRRKRISSSEMKTSSAFRNYSPGEPTVRLYIKNLARQVQEKDLRYVFGRFIDWESDTDKNMFDIRLMTEGRMKGQAFVTLANEKQAIEAVKETNGYVLHTKPLVVQFARSAKPKEPLQKPQGKNS